MQVEALQSKIIQLGNLTLKNVLLLFSQPTDFSDI